MDINEHIRNNIDKSDQEIANELGVSRATVKGRRLRMGLKKQGPDETTPLSKDGQWKDISDRLIEAMKGQDVNPEVVGRVKGVRVSHWTTTIKNADGEAEAHPNEGVQILLDPSFVDGPQWPVVDRAAQAPIKLPKPKQSKSKLKTAIILPVPQRGFRRYILDDKLDSFRVEKRCRSLI